MKEKIIVERKRHFSEPRYSVGVYIDDEFVVNTIKNNRQEIELSLGKHVLKVKQGNRSGEIEIDVKKGKELTCSFSSTFLTYYGYFFLIFALALSYGLDPPNGEGIFLYIPTILITIYTFTIGRKTYFVFEKLIEADTWMNN